MLHVSFNLTRVKIIQEESLSDVSSNDEDSFKLDSSGPPHRSRP
jgi:hypothetical protein